MRRVKSKREATLTVSSSSIACKRAGGQGGKREEGGGRPAGREEEEEVGKKAHTDRRTAFARTRGEARRGEGASLCLLASLVQCLFQDMKISCPRILDVEDSAIGFLETGWMQAECGVSYPMVLLLFCHFNFGHVLTL